MSSVAAAAAAAVPITSEVDELINMIKNTEDPNVFKTACVGIRKLLSSPQNPPISQIVEANIVPKMLPFLNDPNFRGEILWILTNIASGTQSDTVYIYELGILDIVLPIYNETLDENLLDHLFWLLGNIAGDNINYRQELVGKGALDRLCFLLTEHSSLFTKPSLWNIASWFLSHLVNKTSLYKAQVAKATRLCIKLLDSYDEDTINNSLWALSYLSDGDDSKAEIVTQEGILSKLHLFLNASKRLEPALRIVGNIASSSNDSVTQKVLDSQILESIKTYCLTSTSSKMIIESLWCFSNILAGPISHISYVFQIDAIPLIISFIDPTQQIKVQREALFCISNALSIFHNDHFKLLQDYGIVEILCKLALESASNMDLILSILVEMVKFNSENVFICGELVEFLKDEEPQTYGENATFLITTYNHMISSGIDSIKL